MRPESDFAHSKPTPFFVARVSLLIAASVLGLGACRSTPKRASERAGNEGGNAAVASTRATAASASVSAAAVTGRAAATSAISAAMFVDSGFPNENWAELVTARRLFPSAFGFDDGAPKKDVNHSLVYSSHLFDRLLTPPARCLNSVAQPSIADLQLRLLVNTNAEETHRSFAVAETMVLKDRSRHYVIAVPKGANGVLLLRPEAPTFGIHDNEHAEEQFWVSLSDVTVIHPDGHSVRLPPGENLYSGGAILTFTSRMQVRMCANDVRYKAEGCPGSDAKVRASDAPPRDYDLRRCEPGCDQLCAPKEIAQRTCPAPPSSLCVGEKQRVFLDGRDAGGYCVFEEWDIRCERGCRDGRCVGAPQLDWSRKMDKAYVPLPLDAQTLALVGANGLEMVSAEGKTLRREKLQKGEPSRLASDTRGNLFTLDNANSLRAHGEKPWSLQLDSAAPAFETGLRYFGGKLFLVRASELISLNAEDAHREWRADLGASAKPHIEVSETALAVLTVEGDLVLVDPNGSIRGRTRLPAEPLGSFAIDGDTVTAYVKTGEVLFGRFDALKRVALIPQAEWMPGGVAKVSERVVLVNRGTDHHGQTRVYALELPTGRELWTYTAAGELQWPPAMDRHGNVTLVGRMLTSLTQQGQERFQIDFRGGPKTEAAVALGLDGTSFYIRDNRAVTKFTGL